MEKFLYVLCAALVAVLIYGIYDEVTAEKFYLRKDSWQCTAQHTETRLVDYGNNNLVPVTDNVCDRWEGK